MRQRLAALARYIVLGGVVGIYCGVAAALFLWLLDLVTAVRTGHEVIVYALPLAGLAVGCLYERFGRSTQAGTNLVIDTIHDHGAQIPVSLGPLVLLGTVLTHLFGGSAGREGTAVQMGASFADWFAHRLKITGQSRRQLVVAGVAGGFGAVFGTPIAGAVFGLELTVRGRLRHDALVPALAAAIVGDITTRALGIVHTPYPSAPFTPLTALLVAKWILFAGAIAVTSAAFIKIAHALKEGARVGLPWLPLRMFAAGCAVVVLWKLVGTSDYLGLGIPVVRRAFEDQALPAYAFAAKLLFTAVTLAGGFLGGEVTPLFFAGATLGNVLARLLEIPLALGAGVGLAALFAAAANTPLALSIMAVELLGPHIFPHAAIVCILAYWLSGRRSIYAAQRDHASVSVSVSDRQGAPSKDFDRGPAIDEREQQAGE